MFTFKLCTNLEIGGIYREEDLWYDPAKDEPYYIKKDGSKDFDTDNMLQIDRGGHFVLLATGTDNINVHDTYFAKLSHPMPVIFMISWNVTMLLPPIFIRK